MEMDSSTVESFRGDRLTGGCSGLIGGPEAVATSRFRLPKELGVVLPAVSLPSDSLSISWTPLEIRVERRVLDLRGDNARTRDAVSLDRPDLRIAMCLLRGAL